MRSTLLFAGLATLFAFPACGDDSSPPVTQTVLDAGSPDAQTASDTGTPTADAGDTDATMMASPGMPVSLRVAHLSPDAPPFDVCLAPHGTSDFQGPFLAAASAAASDAASDSGAATGLTYGQISAYFAIDQGTYDVRLVAAGATACDAPLGAAFSSEAGVSDEASADADVDADAALVDAAIVDAALVDAAIVDAAITDETISITSSFTTLLVAGELAPSGSDPSLTETAIADDAVLVSGGASLRAVNAIASGVPQDFGFESADGGGFLSVFTHVAFAHAASQTSPGEPPLDSHGYLAIGEQDGVSFGARASADAGADTVATQSLQIDLGSIATVIAIGGDTAGKQPAQLLLCVDNQPSGGALSDCSVLH